MVRKSGKKGKRGAHSSTTLHYVKHFPEDSPRSENREDVGKSRGWRWRWVPRWERGKEGGREAEKPNKYLTKSSGKLIPSLGRLLRRRAPSAASSDESTRSSERHGAGFYSPRFSSCDFRERIGDGGGSARESRTEHSRRRGTVTSVENGGTLSRQRDSLDVRSSRGDNAVFSTLRGRGGFQLTSHTLCLIRAEARRRAKRPGILAGISL